MTSNPHDWSTQDACSRVKVSVSKRGMSCLARISRPSRRCQGVPGSLSSTWGPPINSMPSTIKNTTSPGPGIVRLYGASFFVIEILVEKVTLFADTLYFQFRSRRTRARTTMPSSRSGEVHPLFVAGGLAIL